ncbi:universal stress protein [Bisbaumannia pacifica]|uniref:Universal stress protein n=1 Tax=Bisbaumannia pacifica TaxID=77098 RepID=A0ABD4L0B2_9GAMM|nr:universal stress protein [Halomonas pacifica]MBH8579067.1 universal stress protein [Halomonas pacifica]
MSEAIRRILVPVDASPTSRTAVRLAGELATRWRATLELTHVRPLYPAELSDIPANRLGEADHDHQALNSGEAAAFRHAREALGEDFSAPLEEITLRERDLVHHLARDLLAHLRHYDHALLVVGLPGAPGHLLAGLGDTLLHKATCPVAVVRADLPPVAGIDRLLLPLDGSSHSDRAARLAADLAASGDLPVTLLHCASGSHDGDGDWRFARARRHFADSLDVETRSLVDASPARGLLTEIRRRGGRPLVVMGRRGLGQWRERLLGSVSRRLIAEAPCPVLVVTHRN